jgi:hypothetical protein
MSASPSLPQKTATVAKAAIGWLKGGCPLASESEYERRLAICKPCKRYDADGYKGLGGCLECGCIIPAKLRLGTESCPISNW